MLLRKLPERLWKLLGLLPALLARRPQRCRMLSMAAGGQFKICPFCGVQAPLAANECLQCHHVFRTNFQAGPTVTPGPPPVMSPPPPPPPAPWDLARQRQHPTVLGDPRYLLDTGFGIGCPQCGSTNLVNLGKSGTGLSYFGSLGWVLGAMAVESFLMRYQGCTISCNYCGFQFTA